MVTWEVEWGMLMGWWPRLGAFGGMLAKRGALIVAEAKAGS